MASVVGSSIPGTGSLLAGLAGCAQGTSSGDVDDVADDVDDTSGVDAAPLADAAPIIDGVPPDAACTVQTVNLLTNPYFDAAPAAVGWTEDPFMLAIIQVPPGGITADTGTMIAWMGGYAETSDDHAYQDIVIPADATNLRVTGKLWVETEESSATAFDNASARLLTTGGAVVLDVGAWSNTTATGSYQGIDASSVDPHAGQTLRLQFDASTDGSLATSFFFDTFAVTVTACVP